MAHELVELALKAIENYIKKGGRTSPPPDSKFLNEKAGVFVSLKKRGELRGCIGTFTPTCANIAEETIQNAVSAASKDPRFLPVTSPELPEITCSVDVLSKPEPAEQNELNPKKYGVIVESGFKKGLLLPDLEGVDSISSQIEIAKQKAGILPEEPFKLYRFKVNRCK
jgi:AmmeMemoRadiSam system protein A